jgi:hypothetical protein
VAKKTGSTFKKRQKEMLRQQRQQDKLARRLQKNKERQETGEAGAGDEDPDIAGIIPGPQPRAEDDP